MGVGASDFTRRRKRIGRQCVSSRMISHASIGKLLLLLVVSQLAAQEPYTLKVHTQEVALSFHVEDGSGRAVSDLVQDDVRVRDNGKAPAKITRFVHNEDLPVRVAIVFDESASMAGVISPRRVALALASTVIQSKRDQAMVVRFDFETQVQQDWTSDEALLIRRAAKVTDKNGTRLGGTAIWDTLYRVCRDHVPAQAPGAEVSANAILLFTDGVDNWSHALPQDVVDMCSQRQTPIYPFVIDDKAHMDKGQQALRQMAERTGGSVFYEQGSGASMSEAIGQINKELRDRYTLVYRPASMKLDGKFHSVKVDTPQKATRVMVRDGYFAAP
jgi:Ca-activated chloride channel family protein